MTPLPQGKQQDLEEVIWETDDSKDKQAELFDFRGPYEKKTGKPLVSNYHPIMNKVRNNIPKDAHYALSLMAENLAHYMLALMPEIQTLKWWRGEDIHNDTKYCAYDASIDALAFQKAAYDLLVNQQYRPEIQICRTIGKTSYDILNSVIKEYVRDWWHNPSSQPGQPPRIGKPLDAFDIIPEFLVSRQFFPMVERTIKNYCINTCPEALQCIVPSSFIPNLIY